MHPVQLSQYRQSMFLKVYVTDHTTGTYRSQPTGHVFENLCTGSYYQYVQVTQYGTFLEMYVPDQTSVACGTPLTIPSSRDSAESVNNSKTIIEFSAPTLP